jgi:hypothetical protein
MHEALTEDARQAILKEVPLIEEALMRIYEALDLSSHTCECCQAERKHAFRDNQLAENLRSARQRLRRWEEEVGGRRQTNEREWRNRQTQRV